MQESFLPVLRCPITGSKLQLQVIKKAEKKFNGKQTEIITDAILWADDGLFYPVIKALPRLIPEAIIDYENFLTEHITDFARRKENLPKEHIEVINYCAKKNKRTKESFAFEWSLFNYTEDKTWDADLTGMLNRFLKETNETTESIKNKLVFDVGCGNGMLDGILANAGCMVLAMDLSMSIEKAFEQNTEKNVLYIQGDVQFPPVAKNTFDIVQCSGVLIHTNNTQSSFQTIEAFVKQAGKLSVWLYHPRKNFIHRLFNKIRKYSSKLPLKIQYYIYLFTIFPASFIVKKLKGNKQNAREMMVNILDWFTPQYRWEHEHDEVKSWFEKKNYKNILLTTDELFGFNVVGEKLPDDTFR